MGMNGSRHVVVPEKEEKPGWPPNPTQSHPSPGRPKGKFSPLQTILVFYFIRSAIGLGPIQCQPVKLCVVESMAWWWWQLANHGGPRDTSRGFQTLGGVRVRGMSRLQHDCCSRMFYLPFAAAILGSRASSISHGVRTPDGALRASRP